jgi:putative ABC transport system permease protein
MWFWARWSVRDLRRRWVQVAVIALVIAIGTGVYAGMTSSLTWRRMSYDASYGKLAAHDLHVKLSADSYVPDGSLANALKSMDNPDRVSSAEERLVTATQVEASTPKETVLVPGRIVGVPVGRGEPRVDGIYIKNGKGFSGQDDAVLESHFADQYKLPPEGTVKLAGGVSVHYSGTGLSPEYFIVTSGQGDFLAQANFAVVFMPLGAAQKIAGRPGQVNDLVIKLRPGTDRSAAAGEVKSAMARALPGVGVEVVQITDEPAYLLLYKDLDNDRGTMTAMALLVFIAAAFAAFTLTSRIVESERREIGIDMALGVRRRTIAIRPLLGGAWIAALGIVFGVGMGLLFVSLLRSVFASVFPLPVWLAPLEPAPFLRAAAIGFILPFAASIWPVWRAVRVEPIDAIRTGHLAAKGGGMAPLLKRLHLPGASLTQMPFRNVMRAPRRTVITAIGIGAAIVTLVVVAGSLDSFQKTLSLTSAEVGRGAKNRLTVSLAGFQPVDSPLVHSIEGVPSIGESETAIALGATATNAGSEVDVQFEALDLNSPIWHPTVLSPADAGGLPGIILSSKAARDLDLKPGDALEVRHPVRTSETVFDIRTTRMRLVGIHPNPMRFLAYTDISNAGLFGLAGSTNELQVVPARGYTIAPVKRDLFSVPGVAVVQEPGAVVDATRNQLKSFSDIYRVIEGFALFLALLIAFNAASISSDERARENATMMAFGVRVRTLLRMSVVEGAVIGVLGTLIGLGLGIIALHWLIAQTAQTMPELGLLVSVRPVTIAGILLFGILVVGGAPLFTARKLRRTDVPSTLRVME